MTGRLVVLASGGGTNCQALIDACETGRLDARIVAIITNNADAGVLERAHTHDIAATVVEHRGRDADERLAADRRLIEAIASHEPDVVVLAGWMRILGDEVGRRFRIINLHPALPGELPGIGAIERAFDEWTAGERDHSGVMVHWVPDAGVDVGPVIASARVDFVDGDDLSDFEARMHIAEHRLIVEGVAIALQESGPN